MKRKTIFVDPDGATPIDDVTGLIPANIKTRRQLFIAEARNISKPLTRYMAAVPSKRRAPFTLDWAYKLHGEMFGEVWEWAGTRRTTELNFGVPAYQIDHDLKNLFDDLAAWHEHESFPLIEQSVRLHHRRCVDSSVQKRQRAMGSIARKYLAEAMETRSGQVAGANDRE